MLSTEHCKWCNKVIVTEKGKRGPKKVYCDKSCAARYIYNNPQDARRKYSPKEKLCVFCGLSFLANTSQAFKMQKYCSVTCRGLDCRKHKGSQRICKGCGAAFEPKAGKSNYCGHDCAKPASHKTLRGKRVEKICQACNKKFTVDGAHEFAKYCSRKCRDAIWRNRRRAMEIKATVEEFPVLLVFEKNNWICQICGERVNKSLKHPHPKSASLDHIIPLSKGGKHSRDNVQLSHLVCNIKKGNRNITSNDSGQLMLA